MGRSSFHAVLSLIDRLSREGSRSSCLIDTLTHSTSIWYKIICNYRFLRIITTCLIMKLLQYIIFIVLIAILSGCGHTTALHKKAPPGSYTIKGKTYSPLKQVRPGFFQDGIASWYGPGFHGKKTASGEVYDMHGMTAAHSVLPLNTVVKVANLKTGKEIVVRVNDRGPFVGERVIDLSLAAARELGIVEPGTMPVRVSVIGPGDTRLASRVPVPSAAKKSPRAPNPYYKTPNPYYKKGAKRLLALR